MRQKPHRTKILDWLRLGDCGSFSDLAIARGLLCRARWIASSLLKDARLLALETNPTITEIPSVSQRASFAGSPCMSHTSGGATLREKVFDVSRRLSKSTLLLQVGAGLSNSLTVGIENRDPIMVVALAVKHEFIPAIAMCAGCHSSFSMNRGGGPGSDSPPCGLRRV
jgi:hypothetical protein